MSQTPQSSAQALRKTLGQFATGVAIVTGLDRNENPLGLTINSFTSLSIDPPLVAWSLHRSSQSHAHFTHAKHFAIHILKGEQIDLAEQFYQKKSEERFQQTPFTLHPSNVPILPNTLAWFCCQFKQTVEVGDHTLIIGEVESYSLESNEATPLVFFRSQFFPQLPLQQNS